MSEADTPNNQPQPKPTAPIEDNTSEVPQGSELLEETQIVSLSELRNLRDVMEPSEQEPTTESDVDTTASSATELEIPVAEMSDASLRRANDADWFSLAQKMRQRNRRLHEQVMELRQALREKQEALHLELVRSRDREAIIAQQAEDMKAIQEQLARLFHALESSHQAAQRQQILIETLSEQLQSSQERIAQLERECALTQQRYNDQSHQLLQAANTCRELRTRLYRQQQQTLQFKLALEKSLEMTSATTASGQPQPHAKGIPIHKTQPIQPWSAEQESPQDQSEFETLWNRPIVVDVSTSEALGGAKRREESTENAPALSELPTLPILRRIEETNPPTPTESDTSAQTTIEASQDQDSEASELELEQQLLAEMSSLAEASGLSEAQSDAEALAPLSLEAEIKPDELGESALIPINAQHSSSEDTQELDIDSELEDMEDDELWDISLKDEPELEKDVVLPQSSWPSPLLYPLRPPKKRKSLAAIDLPTFPRYYPT